DRSTAVGLRNSCDDGRGARSLSAIGGNCGIYFARYIMRLRELVGCRRTAASLTRDVSNRVTKACNREEDVVCLSAIIFLKAGALTRALLLAIRYCLRLREFIGWRS